MTEMLQKMGPIAVVLLVFTWFCWPYITGSATAVDSKEAGSVLTLSKELLSPTVKPRSSRDPFRVVEGATAAALAEQLAKAADAAAADKNANKNATKTEPANVETRRTSLVLSGTYIRGNRRMAIIGGKVYKVGEALEGPDADGKLWVVKQVSTDHVVLESRSGTRVIDYSNPAALGKPTNHSGGDSSFDSKPSASSQDGLKPVTSLSDLVRAVEAASKQKP